MRLEGFEGLAVAVMKQAAHDYCEELRWMRDHAQSGINTKMEIRTAVEELVELRRHKKWKQVRVLQEKLFKLRAQAQHEHELRKLEAWFTSRDFSTLSTVDGRMLMEQIQSQLQQDPKFRILLGDDF